VLAVALALVLGVAVVGCGTGGVRPSVGVGAVSEPPVPTRSGVPTGQGDVVAQGGTVRADMLPVLVDATPDGFELDLVTHVAPPSLAPLMADRTVPLTLTVAVYRTTVEPPRTITATLVTYGDQVGAIAIYNRWFAENAFMAAAERNALDVGDQAECFEIQWPPFHAVIARGGSLFALVEADTTVALTQCRALMRALVDGWPRS